MEHFGDFLFGESAEEAQFDDPALARVQASQTFEGLIYAEEFIGFIASGDGERTRGLRRGRRRRAYRNDGGVHSR